MTKLNQERGFSLIEIMIASVILVLALGIFLSLYTMGQRFFKGGMKQIEVVRDARSSLTRMSRDIRSAQSVQIYDDYTSPTGNTQGNYIEIFIPSGNDAGYYLNSQGELRYIADLNSDNPASEADDKKIADEVVDVSGSGIFNSGNIAIEINFRIRDNYAKDGYQGIDISTRVEPRNN